MCASKNVGEVGVEGFVEDDLAFLYIDIGLVKVEVFYTAPNFF
jgi:hypothetical protein